MSGAEYSFWKARSMLASFHDPATLLTYRAARDRLFEPIEEQKIWRWTLWIRKACNPLKSHKTAKEMFGKAWSKTAEIWKGLEKKLGTGGGHPSDVGPPFAKIEAQRARLRSPDAERLLSDLPREPGLTLGINYIR
jgi:hypothetical protein